MLKAKKFLALALSAAIVMTSADFSVSAMGNGQSVQKTEIPTGTAIDIELSEIQKDINKALADNSKVTITKDTKIEEVIQLALPKEQSEAEVVLDLTGNTIYADDLETMFEVEKGITLKIENGTLRNETKNGTIIKSEGIIKLEDVTLNALGKDSVAIINDNEDGASGLVIYSASISADKYAVGTTLGANKEKKDAKSGSYDIDKASAQVNKAETKLEVATASAITAAKEDADDNAKEAVSDKEVLNNKEALNETDNALINENAKEAVKTSGAIEILPEIVPNEMAAPNGLSESSVNVAAPTSLTLQPNSYNTINITWAALQDASGYNLYRSENGNDYALLKASNPTTQFTDTNLTTGKTYYYKVSAIVGGAEGLISSPVSANTTYAKPSNLTYVTENAASAIFSWEQVIGAGKYALYRSTDNITYEKIAQTDTNTARDDGIVAGKTYYYKVAAINDIYEGPQSDALSLKTTLARPTKLKAETVSYNSIKLTWAAAKGAKEYQIYQSLKKDSGYKLIGTTASTSYTSKKLKTNTMYYYKIRAKAGEATSKYSSRTKAKTYITAPESLKAVVKSTKIVRLSWKKVSGAKTYNIYRSTKKNSGYKKIASTSKNAYNDRSVKSGTTYYYKITAVRGKAESGYSNRASARPAPAETSLTATCTNYNQVVLKWTEVKNIDTYIVYRSTKEKSGYKEYAVTEDLTFTDNKVKFGKTYYYKVTTAKDSVESNGVIAKVKTVTMAPTDLDGDSISKTEIKLTWKAADGATSYDVYRSDSANGEFTKLTRTSDCSYNDTGLTFGNTYYYKVCSIRENKVGKYTDVKGIRATISGASGLTITYRGKNKVELEWNAPENYDYFTIMRSNSKDSGYTKLATIKDTSYTNKITEGKAYYYRIYTYYGDIESNYKQISFALPSAIELNVTNKKIKVGNTLTLSAKFTPAETTDQTVTWASSDTTVATVSAGVVTAVSAGTATITAKSSNGKTAKCEITVEGNTKDVIVVLDPGHGGVDPGNLDAGYKEKDLNLAIARYCKEELEKYSGIKVYMTRSDDTYVTVDGRPQKAKDLGADMLISMHMNASTAASASGVEIYSSVNGAYSDSTSKLASSVIKNIAALGLNNRGVKTRTGENGDYYGVIRGSVSRGFGAILIEHAFMSNASDVSYFNSDAKLKALGVADATGIAEYYGLKKK